eukprot:6484128-Prymnesium_polylepis.1
MAGAAGKKHVSLYARCAGCRRRRRLRALPAHCAAPHAPSPCPMHARRTAPCARECSHRAARLAELRAQ